MRLSAGRDSVLRSSRRRRAVGASREHENVKYKKLAIRALLYFGSCVLACWPRGGQRQSAAARASVMRISSCLRVFVVLLASWLKERRA
jgi:hypothetical protein